MKKYDVLIIGAGPCGISASISLKKDNIDVAIIEKSMPGGKINIAPRVDNYPKHEPIIGPDLALEFFMRMNDAGVEMIGDEIINVTKLDNGFSLEGKYDQYECRALLIASGTRERHLGFPREDELLGKGVSYCALCDGHFFKDKPVASIGSEYETLKESQYLSEVCSKVYLVSEDPTFSNRTFELNKVKNKDNVEILTPYRVKEVLATDKVIGIIVENIDTKETRKLDIDGLFPLIGQDPNVEFLPFDKIKNETNNLNHDKNMMSDIPGLFVGGDVTPRHLRQIYVAEHDGMVAAESIKRYLNEK